MEPDNGRRRAGVDVNVSNLSVASFPDGHPDQVVVEQITLSNAQRDAAGREACRAKACQKAFDRSRRNSNPGQYGLSARQLARADRRARQGLSAQHVCNPGGARLARADGGPVRPYRHDALSQTYHRTRADYRADARRRSRAKQARARQAAGHIVAAHGNSILVEDSNISAWTRLWGKGIHLFSPGMLIAAIAAECGATGGRLQRAATRTTALSQHCPCGQRVSKTLAQRTHNCPACGLRADRDVVSAALAACVELADPDDPATARVDYELAHAVGVGLASQQEERVQSTGTSHRQDQPATSARNGSHHRVASAEQRNHQSAHPRTDRPSCTSRDQPNTKPHKRIRRKHDPTRS